MNSRIKKWGNSLGVRIPKMVVDKLNLREDSEVDIDHKNGAIVIVPIKSKFTLDKLLNQIKPNNLHPSDDSNLLPAGKETW